VAEVEEAIDQEIERLQKEPLGKQELEKVKNQLEANFIFGQDSLFFQAMILARYEIVRSWRAIDDYLPSIQAVTPEDILRVANRCLVRENRTVAILMPLPPEKGKQGSEARPGKHALPG
jgi:zinc protease